jgi:hypothetical protein
MRNVNILVNYTCALTIYTVFIGVFNIFILGYRLDNQGIMVQFLAGARDFSLPQDVQTSFAVLQQTLFSGYCTFTYIG